VIYAEGRKETNCGKAGQKKQNEEKLSKEKNMHIVKVKHRTNRQKKNSRRIKQKINNQSLE